MISLPKIIFSFPCRKLGSTFYFLGMSLNFTYSERLSLIILSRAPLVSLSSVLAYLFPWNYLLKVASHAIYSCFLSDTMDWFAHNHSNPFWCAFLYCRGERPKICCSKVTSQLGFSMWFSFHQSEVLTGEINSELSYAGRDRGHEKQCFSKRL